ncbi:hypothetical protein BX070DRAFT_255623 [Coemansia spiralis]|nr:hypothetical protein BX070DRAFT_255623 [Coemansia spiralis]
MVPKIPILLAMLCALVFANTEIRHFTPTDESSETASISQLSRDKIVAALVPSLKSLTGPYETIEFEKLAYLQSTNTTATDRENWYALRNLENGRRYEIRVSYAATTPSDFQLTLFTFGDLLNTYGKSIKEAAVSAGVQNMETSEHQEGLANVAMYVKVAALYAGVSTMPGLENQLVPYVLTLEKHVYGLPWWWF